MTMLAARRFSTCYRRINPKSGISSSSLRSSTVDLQRLSTTRTARGSLSFPSKWVRSEWTKQQKQQHVCSLSSHAIDDSSIIVNRSTVDQDISSNNTGNDPVVAVEDLYSRKTPLEHVLLRPGMYVGPTERQPATSCWVLDPAPPLPPTTGDLATNTKAITIPHENENNAFPFRMVRKEYELVPALIKVFDEILVNASDNRLRHPKTCSRIDVTIFPGSQDKEPFIRVFNDGKGIPIQIHQKENMYVPEMVFGHLLTGSNFDDNEKRVTGGRHGYGAKLTNIFSKSFTIETQDSKKGLNYQQTWYDNMTQPTQPIIKQIAPHDREDGDYTCVSFVPDIKRLLGDNNDPNATTETPAAIIPTEDYDIMCRRVVDVAGCSAGKLQVSLNGKDVSMPSFQEYTNLYRRPRQSDDASPPVPLLFEKINSRWMVGIGLSESSNFESVSFVNGMSTSRGGTHVNAITNQLIKPIQEKILKSYADLEKNFVTQGLIKRHLFVACNALIENPTFDSQMKECLTSSPNNFGTSCTLSDKFIRKILKDEDQGGPGILEELYRVAKGRQQANLLKQVNGKQSKRQILRSIPKLEDAHKAGSSSSCAADCTLILTEGDSAKALAVAGLEVIGRDKFGVFPLRGKFLNVREATVSQLTNNAEVKALVAILGLDFDKEYETAEERAELRYGHIMIMADQDTDGSHIKGLVINFFRHFWPKLLQPVVEDGTPRPTDDERAPSPFLSSFITPLLKASAKRGKKETISFYSMAEYNAWKSSLPDDDNNELKKRWNIKYYKGLGTSTPTEAKSYFAAFEDHHRPFSWNSSADGELLDMVFDKKRAADRREWILNEYHPENSVTVDKGRGNAINYEDFLNNEMIHFSHADNIRSLPSLVDGLKPSQRKVLYACFKRKLKNEIKVAQLGGYCAEHTAYHHGEASLQSTIIGMAQDFVGSNNMNLLVPSGQFGTRLIGGQDAASPRYIFTYLSPHARYLFPELDDALLNYREDDGQTIEPEYYVPILPLLLINGSQGIGTGWSTFIPPHDPRDVMDYVRAKLDHHESNNGTASASASPLPLIRPYARGFKGTIEPLENGTGYMTNGKVEVLSSKSIEINELPLRCWTSTYKDHLLKMQSRGEISNFVENHTTSAVSFKVKMRPAQVTRLQKSSGGFERFFKLKSKLLTTNMNAFDANNTIQKFESPQAIADAYFPVRMDLYHDRKSVLESESTYFATMLRNKARFIQFVTDGEIDLVKGRRTRDDLVEELRGLGFDGASQLDEIRKDNKLQQKGELDNEVEENDDASSKNDDISSTTGSTSDFDYLLNLPLSSLTSEKIVALKREADKKEEDLNHIKAATPADLWRADLDKLSPHL